MEVAMFEDMEVISCYTWDDAVNDGMFVNVSRLASKAGFTLPVAITSNLFHTHLERETEQDTDLRINTLLMLLAINIKRLKENGEANSNHIACPITFDDEKDERVTQVWATIEGRSPKNPEPVMTIMLPEDY
jgi:hypothetical protein